MLSPTLKNKRREHEREGTDSGYGFLSSSERESSFSLEIRAIRPSAVFGTKRKAALCGEGFAWVPDLGSFLKL